MSVCDRDGGVVGDTPSRILLVDDQVLYREAVRSLIDRWSEFEVVAEASDGAEAVELACALKPVLILLDVRMPKMDGVEATRRIVRHVPDAKIVMLTVESDQHAIDGHMYIYYFTVFHNIDFPCRKYKESQYTLIVFSVKYYSVKHCLTIKYFSSYLQYIKIHLSYNIQYINRLARRKNPPQRQELSRNFHYFVQSNKKQ